jgi:hypothetical protein
MITWYPSDYQIHYINTNSHHSVVNGAIIVNRPEKSGTIGLYCMQKEFIMPFILVNGHTPPFPVELSKGSSLSLAGYSQATYSSECLNIWSNRLFFQLKGG